MKVKKLYELLNTISPFELQESWDNSGLQVGSLEDDYEHIEVALDIDEALLDRCKAHTLLITHHPLLFRGIKSLDTASYPGSFIKTMIEKNITLISMHTNYDKTHLNRYVLENVLGYEAVDEADFVLYFEPKQDFDTFLQSVQNAFSLTHIKYVKTQNTLKRAALTTGSGMDLLSHIDADVFLTGDIKYHQAMEAKARQISLIEIGHYESEIFFAEYLQKELRNHKISAIITACKNPFE